MKILQDYIPILENLCREHQVAYLWLFGSYAKNTFHQESDLDFLVHFGKIEVVDYFDNLMDFKEKLENLFHKKVDLLEIQALKNPFLKESIDNSKILVYGTGNREIFA